MKYPLAVLAPVVGTRTETFIRRHMEDLLPGGTVVVADTSAGPYGGHWSLNGPVLELRHVRDGGFCQRVFRAVSRRLGRQHRDDLDKAIRRFLKQHRVQVAIGEYLDWSEPWVRTVLDLGIRFFAHAHGSDISISLRDPRRRAGYLAYNQANGIITMSQISSARLIELGLAPDRVHVIPYGVDVPPEFVTRVERDTIRCIAVGRMVAKKAPILTLDAFRRAATVYPNLRLNYVGAGELLPAARQFVSAFDLSDRVTLHGGQPSEVVERLMMDADIFLQHSMPDPDTGDEEGLPVSILEAMARGLPVVATHHAGIPEAVVDGVTGYLAAEGDSKEMAERILGLVREPGLRQKMGEAGWWRAKEHFSWEKERSALLRVLGLDPLQR